MDDPKSARPDEVTIFIKAPSRGALWAWVLVIGGVLPALIALASGARLGVAVALVCIPLSVAPVILAVEMTLAQGTTLTVRASGRASFHQSYLVGLLSWNGLAADISNVRVKPADGHNETEPLLSFCLCGKDDIEVVCMSDEAAMDAARALNAALGVASEPAVVADAPSGPSYFSVKNALAKAAHVDDETPDAQYPSHIR